jgi:hypothetical protein
MVKHGSVYAVLEGTRKGNFLVVINTYSHKFDFLALPSMSPVTITTEDIAEGIQKKILEHVEKLPDDIYNLCIAQYEKSNS